MRKFTSYGQINKKLHYYVGRGGLVNKTYQQLVEEVIEERWHYITV